MGKTCFPQNVELRVRRPGLGRRGLGLYKRGGTAALGQLIVSIQSIDISSQLVISRCTRDR